MESLKVVLINLIKILMMSAKLSTPGLLNTDYDVRFEIKTMAS